MSQRVFLRLRFESYGFKTYKIIASRAGTVSRAGARNFKAVGFEPQPEKTHWENNYKENTTNSLPQSGWQVLL